MGNYNCCGIHDKGSPSSAVWAAGDDCGVIPEKEDMLDGKDRAYLSSAEGSTVGQLKIRISKKQLEELLKKMEGSGAQKKKVIVDDQGLLQRLIDESYAYHLEIHDHHQRSWKPVLQSIPEIN